MKVAILGYAAQGMSAYEYWSADRNDITICDLDESVEAPAGVSQQLGKDYLEDLERFDLLVRTPIIHPKDIQAANPQAPDILDKVTTTTNEFFKVCPSKHIIGVTGTKGKGTTSTLIAKMLEAAGKRVHLGGNIGTPPLDMLKESILPEDYVVLELANFQLIDLKHSPFIGVCLMVVPEHLNWHADMKEYVTAKQGMFRWQKKEDIAIYFADNENSLSVVSVSPGQKVPYYKPPGADIVNGQVHIEGQSLVSVEEIKLLGKHNWQNICAAVTAVWQVSQDINAIRSVLTSFGGMEHRLALVREFDGVKYYDDSFGTTPETAIVAIEAFAEPKVVILGGSDKGASFDQLAEAVRKNNIRKAVLIGERASAIESALHQAGFTETVRGGETMQQIVETARESAKNGDIVLLSTGCASFGLFDNYKDRADQFIKVVRALA